MAKYKKRKDGRYSTSITIGRDETGNVIKKTIYGKTMKEVDEKKAEILGQINSGTFILDNTVTLGEWAIEWLEAYKSNKEYNTVKMYKHVLKKHINPCFGMYKIKDIKSHHIQKYINILLAEGKYEMSRKVLITLKQILDKAIDENMINRNPCQQVELPTKQKNERRSLTENEKEIVYNADLNTKQRAFLYTMMFAGLRKGETLALTIADINMKDKTINVTKSLTVIVNKTEFKTPKSQSGNRIVPMPDILYSALEEHIKTLDGFVVFPSAKGTIMSDSAYKCFWKNIIERLNTYAGGTKDIKIIANDITAHLFRHTYATTLYNAGVDIKTAQYLLGHADIKMTLDVYTHLDKENNIDAAKKINDMLSSQLVVSNGNLADEIQ